MSTRTEFSMVSSFGLFVMSGLRFKSLLICRRSGRVAAYSSPLLPGRLRRLQTRTDDRNVGAFRAKKIRIILKVLFRKFEIQAPGTPSVDQLLVLLSVVEERSLTGAAKRLRRATSHLRYANDTHQTPAGLCLFYR